MMFSNGSCINMATICVQPNIATCYVGASNPPPTSGGQTPPPKTPLIIAHDFGLDFSANATVTSVKLRVYGRAQGAELRLLAGLFSTPPVQPPMPPTLTTLSISTFTNGHVEISLPFNDISNQEFISVGELPISTANFFRVDLE